MRISLKRRAPLTTLPLSGITPKILELFRSVITDVPTNTELPLRLRFISYE
jgi:hypothetical protein